MSVLLGIIAIHLLIIISGKLASQDRMPYGSVILLTMLMAGYVLMMMYAMETPQP